MTTRATRSVAHTLKCLANKIGLRPSKRARAARKPCRQGFREFYGDGFHPSMVLRLCVMSNTPFTHAPFTQLAARRQPAIAACSDPQSIIVGDTKQVDNLLLASKLGGRNENKRSRHFEAPMPAIFATAAKPWCLRPSTACGRRVPATTRASLRCTAAPSVQRYARWTSFTVVAWRSQTRRKLKPQRTRGSQ